MSNALRWTPDQVAEFLSRRKTHVGPQPARLVREEVRDMSGVDIDRVHKKAKYGNERTDDGFDSKREARRYRDLCLREKANEISDLHRQVPFRIDIKDEHVCTYKADFTYVEGGALVVEDTKGYRTPVYRLKKKLMKAVHGIEIREV